MFINNVNKINDYVSLGGQQVIINLNELRTIIEHDCKTPDEINKYVQSFPTNAFAEGMIDERDNVYGIYHNRPTLGNLINEAQTRALNNQEVFFCRERAILAHVILASIGIPSIIVVANDRRGRRHAFVQYWHKSVAKILDPEQRFLPTSYDPDAYHGYIYNVNTKELVRPNHILEGYARPQMGISNQ